MATPASAIAQHIILSAVLAGKQIHIEKDGEWNVVIDPGSYRFDFLHETYRIAPERKYRPWNSEECAAMVGKVIARKDGRSWRKLITAGGDHNGAGITVDGDFHASQQVMIVYVMPDGSPCGVEEK